MDRSLWLVLAVLAAAPLAGCLADEPEGDDGSPDDSEEPSGPEGTPPPEDGSQAELNWSQRPAVPTPRTEVATTILEDDLYVIGGFEANNEPSGVVEVLDLVEDEWQEAASLPVPLHHARAVALDGSIHVFGGYNAIPFQATPTHLVYDPGAEAWSQGEPLPNARGGHGAAVLNETVYLVGGVGADGELVATVDVYHGGNGSYTEAAELPTPRDHLGVAASEDWIHTVGGREQSLDTNQATHEILVPGEEWVQGSPMPTARGGVDATTLANHVVVAGGEASDDTFDEVEAWDPVGGDWVQLPAMPTARHGLGVDAYQGELVTTAGGPEPGLSVSDAVEVIDLLPGQNGTG